MADVFTPQKRSEVMSRIRGSGNRSTEQRMIALMREAKLTGWRRKSSLVGKPDFVFKKSKVAVFVDGDFWHGHPIFYRAPRTNSEFWAKKIRMNKARDRLVSKSLRLMGWRVVRVWESTLAKHPEREIARLCRFVASPIK